MCGAVALTRFPSLRPATAALSKPGCPAAFCKEKRVTVHGLASSLSAVFFWGGRSLPLIRTGVIRQLDSDNDAAAATDAGMNAGSSTTMQQKGTTPTPPVAATVKKAPNLDGVAK